MLLPKKVDLDSYECHVGINYQRFVSIKNELKMDLLSFIPLKDNVVVYKLTLTNNSKEKKSISVYGGVEFCLWNAVDDSTNFQRNLSTGEVEILEDTIIHKTEYRERRNHFAYFSTNKKPDSFESDRDSFLGNHRDYTNPIAIENKHLFNRKVSGYSPVAFFQNKIDLEPQESTVLIYLLGYFENDNDKKFDEDGNLDFSKASVIKDYYLDVNHIDEAFNLLNKDRNNLLNNFTLESSDKKLDAQVNIWHQYQCLTTYHLSRSASYYESGIGRGMGFRDSCQDLLGFVHIMPKNARDRILDLASIMFKDGSTYHQYQPLDKKEMAI